MLTETLFSKWGFDLCPKSYLHFLLVNWATFVNPLENRMNNGGVCASLKWISHDKQKIILEENENSYEATGSVNQQLVQKIVRVRYGTCGSEQWTSWISCHVYVPLSVHWWCDEMLGCTSVFLNFFFSTSPFFALGWIRQIQTVKCWWGWLEQERQINTLNDMMYFKVCVLLGHVLLVLFYLCFISLHITAIVMAFQLSRMCKLLVW